MQVAKIQDISNAIAILKMEEKYHSLNFSPTEKEKLIRKIKQNI